MSSLTETASRAQAAASDPTSSVFVTANAGSGKTHVLVNRVIRMLLAGTPPERLLCLTFTRAAAAEMSRRLFEKLAGWIALQDEALIDLIHTETGHARLEPAELANARQLFARALETPGGLKVETIHAFCERLLQRFPVEAGVVPGFEVMDEEAAGEMLRQARAGIIEQAGHPDHADAQAVKLIVALSSIDDFDRLLNELLNRRDVLKPFMDGRDGLAAATQRVEQALGLTPDLSQLDILTGLAGGLDRDRYRRAADALRVRGGKLNDRQAETIDQMLVSGSDEVTMRAMRALFLTAEGAPRKPTGLLTKTVADAHREIADFLFAEQDRFLRYEDQLRAVKIRDATVALLQLAMQIVARYEATKRRLGRYDYTDLILRTLSLLTEMQDATWVLYKLDGGLDHILVDEAQDTSPEQWEIVKHLAEEFFAGEGARGDVERTVFAVGDRKQSIFSFQGADPEVFDDVAAHFRQHVTAAGKSYETVPLSVSFRSTPEVLKAVDAVFDRPQAARGVRRTGHDADLHEAVRRGQAGLVEIWPVITPEPKAPRSPWMPHGADDPMQHPRVILASQIARRIRSWVGNDEPLRPGGAPIRYQDILILVRRRTTFMDALVRALKLADIPVAGADRLKLTGHIAVQDLIALGRFILLPQDDLTLAAVLKSPLVCRDDGLPFDDDDLFALAHDRGGASLWQRLRQAVQDGAAYERAVEDLSRWLARTGFQPPYEFYSTVLIAEGRRKRLLQRLGTEAAEPVDEFLRFAGDFDHAHTPSLHGFLEWLEASDIVIKRDMDEAPDEVRVMTVHGAKGLESNIVILPDTCEIPSTQLEPSILYHAQGPHDPTVPVWRLRAGDSTAATDEMRMAVRDRNLEEYNRLLYVAMTRARDRLYITGYHSSQELKPESWYAHILAAMKTDPDSVEVLDDDGETLCWRLASRGLAGTGDETAGAEEGRQVSAAVSTGPDCLDLPDWALRHPDTAQASKVWHPASRLLALAERTDEIPELAERYDSPLVSPSGSRFLRGTLIHKLLQLMPDLPESERVAKAARLLSWPGYGLDETAREEIAGEVFALMNAPSFSSVFAPGSRAEVPIAGMVSLSDGVNIPVSGQIDRLVVTDNEILVVDYKTNRPPARTPDEVDPAYTGQLAAYSAILKEIYPRHQVRAALIWTAGPDFMEIPAEMLKLS